MSCAGVCSCLQFHSLHLDSVQHCLEFTLLIANLVVYFLNLSKVFVGSLLFYALTEHVAFFRPSIF